MLLSKQEIKQQQRLHFALLFWSLYSTADLIRKNLGGKNVRVSGRVERGWETGRRKLNCQLSDKGD